EGRPDLSLSLKGSGPADGLTARLGLDSNGGRVLDGEAVLARDQNGLGFKVRLDGPVARLVPRAYRGFFGETTALSAEGRVPDAGGAELSGLHLKGGQITLDARAATAPDGFLSFLAVDGQIADPSGRA